MVPWIQHCSSRLRSLKLTTHVIYVLEAKPSPIPSTAPVPVWALVHNAHPDTLLTCPHHSPSPSCFFVSMFSIYQYMHYVLPPTPPPPHPQPTRFPPSHMSSHRIPSRVSSYSPQRKASVKKQKSNNRLGFIRPCMCSSHTRTASRPFSFETTALTLQPSQTCLIHRLLSMSKQTTYADT